MCFRHEENALAQWKRENGHRKNVFAWKILRGVNQHCLGSTLFSKDGHWKPGVHEEEPRMVSDGDQTSRGLYVFLKKPSVGVSSKCLIVRFSVRPADVVMMGKPHSWGATQAICRRLVLTEHAVREAYKERERRRRR